MHTCIPNINKNFLSQIEHLHFAFIPILPLYHQSFKATTFWTWQGKKSILDHREIEENGKSRRIS